MSCQSCSRKRRKLKEEERSKKRQKIKQEKKVEIENEKKETSISVCSSCIYSTKEINNNQKTLTNKSKCKRDNKNRELLNELKKGTMTCPLLKF